MKTHAVSSVLVALVLALPASSQVLIPPPVTKPREATNLYPNGVLHAASVPRLMWKQGGFFATQQQPPAAAYFRICIYVAAAGQSCDSPAFHWMHAAGATVLNRTPVYSALRGQQVTATYRYSFDVPADLELDLSYGWNVGACKSSAPGSCAYPPHPALLRFSTRNLTVTDIEEVIRSDYIAMATEVTNTGITDAGPFRVKSEIVQAEYDEESGKCATRLPLGTYSLQR
jgi:hypothetical protein